MPSCGRVCKIVTFIYTIFFLFKIMILLTVICQTFNCICIWLRLNLIYHYFDILFEKTLSEKRSKVRAIEVKQDITQWRAPCNWICFQQVRMMSGYFVLFCSDKHVGKQFIKRFSLELAPNTNVRIKRSKNEHKR